jgi:hypothetical protein
MAFTKSEAVGFLTGIVLILVAGIFVARLLPYMYHYMTVSPSDINTTLSDVPGGGLWTGLIIFLISLVAGIALVLKVFDLL